MGRGVLVPPGRLPAPPRGAADKIRKEERQNRQREEHRARRLEVELGSSTRKPKKKKDKTERKGKRVQAFIKIIESRSFIHFIKFLLILILPKNFIRKLRSR